MNTVKVMAEVPLKADNETYKMVTVSIEYEVEEDDPSVGYIGGIVTYDATSEDADVDANLLDDDYKEELVAGRIGYDRRFNRYDNPNSIW